jgi:hypothetical protein
LRTIELTRREHAHADVDDRVFKSFDGHEAEAIARGGGWHRLAERAPGLLVAVVRDEEGADLGVVKSRRPCTVCIGWSTGCPSREVPFSLMRFDDTSAAWPPPPPVTVGTGASASLPTLLPKSRANAQ